MGTDAGLNVFPETSESQKYICKVSKHKQIWGISQLSHFLFVATFDSGLYKFDLNQGELIKHWTTEEMPRIRKIRKINEQLYILHGKGLSQISPYKTYNLFQMPLTDMESQDFPIEIFTVNGQLHVSFYKTDLPYRKTQEGLWVPVRLFPKNMDSLNRMKILCGKEINGKTYLGLFSNKYAVFEKGSIKFYQFISKHSWNLAVWDLDGEGDNIYLAIGNNSDRNNGYFWKHNPHDSSVILLKPLDKRKYAWSVRVDPIYKGVWYSTITNGIYFQPHRENWISAPIDFENFKITNNFIIVWNSFFAYIKPKGHFKWDIIPITSPITDIIEISEQLYFINNQHFFSYTRDNKIDLISKGNYQSFCEHEGKIYLFRLFGNADFYEPNNKRLKKNFHPKTARVIQHASNDNILLLHIENEGLFYVENDMPIPIKTDWSSDIIKNQFFFCHNHLISQIGSKIRISTVNRLNKTVKTHQIIDLAELFPDIKIDWIKSNQKSFWVGNSETAFEFQIDSDKHDLKYLGQYYLGQSPLRFETIQITADFIYKKGQGEIIVIPLSPKNAINFKSETSHKLNGYVFNFATIIPRVWEGQLLTLTSSSNNYLYNRYGQQLMEIWNTDEILEKKFISIQKSYVLDNFPNGHYNLNVLAPNGYNRNILFKVNLSIFYNIGFWMLFIISFLLLGYVVFQYQREKLLLNQKVISLQLNTLKANLNPHFIFNIMNLIQSLIVKSEKNKALKATSELAILNRLFLETSNKDLIPLEEELAFAKKYLGLEKMRFEEDSKIHFKVTIDPQINIKEWYVPPLILQPLLENALKHGFNSATETNVLVDISNLEPHQLNIKIANPMRKRSKSKGINLGISLVKDRLSLLNERYYHDYYASFKVYENLEGLFVASITIEKKNIAWVYQN